jgi:carboxypeptidase family protein
MFLNLATRHVSALAIAALLAAIPPLATEPARQSGAIEGSATDSSGTPLAGVEIQLLDAPLATRTDAGGRYRLASVAAGTHLVSARRVGLEPASLVVEVTESGMARADFTMAPAAVTSLAPVMVKSTSRGALTAPAAFHERMATGQGKFLTDSDLVRMHPRLLSDVMRRTAGLVVAPNGQVFSNRGAVTIKTDACRYGIPVFVDGVQVGGGNVGDPESLMDNALSRKPDFINPTSTSKSIVDQLKPANIAAIEIYNGPATAPASIAGAVSSCGAILIWTK